MIASSICGRHVDVDLAHPRLLAVAMVPLPDGVDQPVELRAAMGDTRPDVGNRVTEFGMPQQRREIIECDDHPDVIDRAVGEGTDRTIGRRLPSKEPDVAGAGDAGRLVEGHRGVLGVNHRGRTVAIGTVAIDAYLEMGWPRRTRRRRRGRHRWRGRRPCSASDASSSTPHRTTCATGSTHVTAKHSTAR